MRRSGVRIPIPPLPRSGKPRSDGDEEHRSTALRELIPPFREASFADPALPDNPHTSTASKKPDIQGGRPLGDEKQKGNFDVGNQTNISLP